MANSRKRRTPGLAPLLMRGHIPAGVLHAKKDVEKELQGNRN
jgi:hypothetical protein